MEPWRARKVVIVGAGAVGATFAYALAQSGVADEIVLSDMDANLAQGQVMDLAQAALLSECADRLGAQDYPMPMVVITAGSSGARVKAPVAVAAQRRIIGVMDGSRPGLAGGGRVIAIRWTPATWRNSASVKRRVIGSGMLDSALRYLLSQHCGVNVHNVHAYILGEHGDSEFAAWSMTHVAGMKFDEYCQMCGDCQDWQEERREIEEAVRTSAYHIIGYKGATYFAVGQALVRIISAIVRNERSVLSVSTVLEGEYGLSGVCLGVPAMVGEAGVERVLEMELPAAERSALERSAGILKQALAQLSLGESQD
jgi:L-lactate dehydrogenase